MTKLLLIWLTLFGAVAIPSAIQGSVTTTAAALDGPGLTWSRFGGGGVTTPADTHDGVDAFKTSSIGNNGYNFVRCTVTGPGTLTFWWKVSSEYGFDIWGFWIGAVGGYLTEPSQVEISGEVNWTQQTFSVPEGTQTLEWAYVKDGSDSAGADRAWLDEVFYTPDPPAIIDDPLDAIAAVGSNVTFSITYQVPDTTSSPPTPKFFWQLNSTNLPGKTNITLSLTNVQLSQSGNYRVIITNAYGKATSEVASLAVFLPVYLDVALDATGMVWTTDGDAKWFGLKDDATNTFSHDGIDVARSGLAPEDFEQLSFDSWIQTTVTGPGTLKFWWRMAGLEADQFYLSVGGSLKTNVPPDDGTWQEEIVAVPAGSKTLKWTYLRDDFISTDDSDGAYLDQVRFFPATNAPPKFSLPSCSTNGFSARIELDPFRGYTIQRSTNLTTWTNVMIFTNSESIFDFLDTTATNSNRRFYRIKSP